MSLALADSGIERSAGSRLRLGRELVLSAVAILYVFYAVAYQCQANVFCRRALESVEQFFYYWRLDQSWELFAPDVQHLNWHLTVVITFRDGTRMVYVPIRAQTSDFIERFRKIKQRDFERNVWRSNYKDIWPDYANWIAGRFYSADNPPVALALYNSWIEVPDPRGREIVARDKLPKHTKFYFLYYYRFKEGDLANHTVFR